MYRLSEANEGRVLTFLPHEHVEKALSILHKHVVSQEAIDIGEVQDTPIMPHQVLVNLHTTYGTERILDFLSEE